MQGLRASWADTMHEKATQLRDQAEAEHSLWITLLMAKCEHHLLIRPPYGDDTPAWSGERNYCPRCAGLDSVPGRHGQRLRLMLTLADLYDRLGGVKVRV